VLARLANLPQDAFKAPVDFSIYPRLTVIAALLAISATAGVVEEAGFRGFMLSPIQRRHGWSVAILITGLMFFLDHHLSHAYATFAFLPFFLAISVVHGLLVRFTGSIRPSIVLHGVRGFPSCACNVRVGRVVLRLTLVADWFRQELCRLPCRHALL